jgi:hypothetical protein
MIELDTEPCEICGEQLTDCSCVDCDYCDEKVSPHFYAGRVTCPHCGNSLEENNEDDPRMVDNWIFVQQEVEALHSRGL